MPQFWTDFSADTVGAVPSGWTLDGFLAGECTVVSTAGARGGRELHIAPGTSARRTAVWDLPGSVADAEILVRMRSAAETNNRYPVMVRKNSSGASLQCYTLKLSYTDGIRGGKYNTSYADLGTADVTKTGLYNFDQPTKYFYVRLRVNGTSYKARAWNADVAEPSTWDIDTTDTTLASAGGIGLFAYYATSGMYIDSIGVGTGGDTAPDAAVVSVVADFTGSPTTGANPLSVTFTDASTNAVAWAWDFGDGNTSTQQSPTHSYANPGTYSVTLSINSGAASKTRTNYIGVSDVNAPTLDGNFEGGNINTLLSSVAANGGDWTVNIVPRKQLNDYIATEAWWYFAFKMTKVTGKRPTFNLPWTDWVGKGMSLTAPKTGWVPCYSYTPNDPTSWVYATAITWNSPTAQWQFPTAFAQDTVYIAYRPMLTPSMIRTWVNGLSGISNLPGKSNYVVSTLAATTDETGRTVPAQDVLGFRFGTGPGQMVIASGVHPCEDHGTMVMQAFVEALLADAAFCAAFTVQVYPCVNPQGRWARDYRGTREAGHTTTDAARDWSDTPTLACVQAVRTSIMANVTGSRPDILIDFHGHYQHLYSHSVYGWSSVAANWTIEQAYQSAVGTALNIGALYEPSSGAAVNQLAPYFSTKASGGAAGMFLIVEISDWLADQYTASRAYGTLLAGQLAGIEDDVYTRWPIGSAGAIDAVAGPSAVSIALPAVTNAALYRILRDGVQIRAYAPGRTFVDNSVEHGKTYAYTYQARNPAGQSAVSAEMAVEIVAPTGITPWGQTPWGAAPWSSDTTPWGVEPWSQ